MRWSKTFIPTLRDDPADAEAPSHVLMLRAGLIRQLAAGIYSHLPLGKRVLHKVEAIVREEMDAIGALEFFLPALTPAEPWKESGRWDEIGELFRLQDRRGSDMCLGFTHEEIFTSLARGDVRSYRDLPQIWYQIQIKFRDEPRPKSGVLRGRQFIMKDAYSFDLDTAGLDRSFDRVAQAYHRIFERCGIDTLAVEASSGVMGGSESVEFMSFSDAGENWVVRCGGCGYAADLEKAESLPSRVEDPDDTRAPEKFPTPGIRTIDQLAAFEGGAPGERQVKTLVYVVAGEPALFLLRGDHELCDEKLVEVTGSTDVRPAHPDEIRAALGASAGSVGAVGVTHLPIWIDTALRGRRGMTTGANADDFHLRHVDVERDVRDPRWVDLRSAVAGDACTRCGKPLEFQKSIEVGHIFKLGTRYTEKMGARVLTAEGVEVPIVMGSYGIGIDRTVAAVIEAHHDANGISWPLSIAPYQVEIVPVGASDEAQARAAEELYAELGALGLEVLLDDRDERAGVKFKDADLIGIPFRIVIGPRGLAEGKVELVCRATGSRDDVPIGNVAAELEDRMQA